MARARRVEGRGQPRASQRRLVKKRPLQQPAVSGKKRMTKRVIRKEWAGTPRPS